VTLNLAETTSVPYGANLFSNRVVSRWNLLCQRAVDAPSLNAFKNRLFRIRDNQMGFFMDEVC